MRNYFFHPAAFALLLSISSGAFAQSEKPWDGGYFGVNLGDASGSACNTWTSTGLPLNTGSGLENRVCAQDSLAGGIQFGETVEYKRLLVGLGVDIDAAAGHHSTRSIKYTGPAPTLSGNYVYTDQPSPKGFAVLGPRIGYAGDLWLPYLRAGVIVAGRFSTFLHTDQWNQSIRFIQRWTEFFYLRLGRGWRH
jgi:hypothetical protein